MTSALYRRHSCSLCRKSRIHVKPLETECEDGTWVKPLTIDFKEGVDVMPCNQEDGQSEPFILEVRVTFKSEKPLAFSEVLTFTDDLGNE